MLRRRWASTHKLIFRAPDDGMAYRITYQSPLTEHQECDPWFDADEVKATEVEQRPVVAQQWLPVDAPRDPGLDTVLPAWEAMYEPGNVSDYLIGYANSEAAAKGAAEAWLRSQKDEPGRLEWVPQTPLDGYDTEAELIERHDDGIDTGPGITVRRRTPAAAPPGAASPPLGLPCTSPPPPSRARTQVNTARCVSRSISRRVREIVEWSGGASGSVRPRKSRSVNESAARHAMPRSESIPSKEPTSSSRK